MNPDEIDGTNLSGRVFSMEEEEHVYFFSLSSDNKYAAAVYGNGALRILDPLTLETYARAVLTKAYEDLPCTCVRWFPTITEEDNRQQYRLISVSSAGGVFGWRWDGIHLLQYKKAHEKNNEISTMDISPSEDTFITAGKDRIVRLYDSESFEVTKELTKGVDEAGLTRVTHISRIFSARFLTKTLGASAGWESPLQLWDFRTLRSERQIPGCQGVSDCIEPMPNGSLLLLTANKGTSKIQLLDCVQSIEMEKETQIINSSLSSSENPVVSRYSSSSLLIWSACASPNKLIGIRFSTGEIVASIDLPSAPLNLTLMGDESRERIYVCCQDGYLVALHQV